MRRPGDIANEPSVRAAIGRALREDVGTGDATTRALVPPARQARAVILARRKCVIGGGSVAAAVFRRLDPRMSIRAVTRDGAEAGPGQAILRISGSARAILTGERTALNFLQRLSGIATLTREFVRRTRGSGVRILDTRKTTPGLRLLEKYAVRCGGGTNHRIGLYDMLLVKDNHRALWREDAGPEGLFEAARAARAHYPGLPLEVEVESEAELRDVLRAGPDWVLLDNMSPSRLRRCVAIARGRARLEASGGVTLRNVRAVAATGVDAVSLGCLTHSAPAVDLSLELEAEPARPRRN